MPYENNSSGGDRLPILKKTITKREDLSRNKLTIYEAGSNPMLAKKSMTQNLQ